MYKKYFNERVLISKGNLVEIRYEDFISDPFSETKKIYESLSLEGFSDAERAIKAYILTQSEIKTANYKINDNIKDKVYSNWAFVFDKLKYDP